MKTYNLSSMNYNRLAIYAKRSADTGKIQILDNNQKEIYANEFSYDDYQYHLVSIQACQQYTVKINSLDISLGYMYSDARVLEEGLCFIEFNQTTEYYNKYNISQRYSQKFRNQYHFTPFKNWLNDPNGLCYFQGKYHMFYQYNPHQPVWGNMHWGHAVSDDLLNWTHLPIALFPQKSLFNNQDYSGGAFSGSAIVVEDSINFLFTRSYSRRGSKLDLKETQAKACSIDGIEIINEKTIIEDKPLEDVSLDFRDPKVLRDNNQWYLVLGSAVDSKPAVLLYSSTDLEEWEYQGVLLEEEEISCTCIECPDLIKLGDKYVLIASLMNSVDELGRKNLSVYYLGDFNNNKFTVESKGLLDFGTNYYAQQSFVNQGKVISIGWISDFYGEYQHEKNSSNGSMTLPRQFLIEEGKLLIRPIPEIKKLREKLLYKTKGNDFIFNGFSDNRLELVMSFNESTDLNILLVSNEEQSIRLIYEQQLLEIKTDNRVVEDIVFAREIDEIHKLDIFIDRNVMEIYVNDGECVGTKLYFIERPDYSIEAQFNKPNNLEDVEIYEMKSIW